MRNFGLFHIVSSVPFYSNAMMWHLPPGWEQRRDLSEAVSGGTCYYNKKHKLAVIVSLDTMTDGKTYLHVSLSRPDRIPDWNTVKRVKDIFIGKKQSAFIYFPPEDEYVNLMPYCLHLWSKQDA